MLVGSVQSRRSTSWAHKAPFRWNARSGCRLHLRAEPVKLEQIKNIGRRALAVQADCADPAALIAAVDESAETLGALNILVNNAAVFVTGPLEEMGQPEIDRTLAVNVRAPLIASQAAVRHMDGGGSIVNIGSNIADRTPFPGLALYAMSKTALIGTTKGLARELGPHGITVNVVHPGPTDTDSNPAHGPDAAAMRWPGG